MIREAEGNLLTADVDALVNTVNTVGVMGKGIALQFKRAYPEMYKAYARAAKAGEVVPGRMFVWHTEAMSGPSLIINFPTKRHWRSPSRLEDIRDGLRALVHVVSEAGVESIALPPLGCGNGGLQWSEVRPLIVQALGGLPIEVVLYPPKGAPRAAAMVENRQKPKMTPGRAALLGIMSRYREVTLEAPSVIEVQKLMYFLQEAGQPLRLNYVKGRYGPYADNLRHVLTELEGHYISGFGDGSAKVGEAEPLELLDDGGDETRQIVMSSDILSERLNRVLRVVSGYESAYGLELLASVHWVAEHDDRAAESPEIATELVSSWTPRKSRLFTPEHVRRAWETLREQDWLPRIAIHN
ncbi:type II toxin-antitoxin system antitoxin DNA ADP-ribosyl glycohydrolase DarG [Flexivirga oryzae]|uniref:O-acetyl-ADP-ribose deacetylase (Regulator of RNase III) n=1 Tax=Flexivirga oryzae TaxID=1794944 RepID=A0A839N1Y6_9MICO|nr:O-acetyl-ADP-ribose deacetylase (regulator of RNase III) [Flexivirga oryzae]